jgi:hypothetical protein
VRDDIPRLAHIHVVACLPDSAFKLYFATPQEFEKRVTEMFKGQVSDPKWQHIKAVDKRTSVIAAWALWNTPTDAQIQERDEKVTAKTAGAEKEKGTLAKDEFDFLPGLPMFVQEGTDRWLEKWTRGQWHMLCKALFIEPLLQGRGMGKCAG